MAIVAHLGSDRDDDVMVSGTELAQMFARASVKG